jgi:hypothetical protein
MDDKEKCNYYMFALIHSDNEKIASAAKILKREFKAASKEAAANGTSLTWVDLCALAADCDDMNEIGGDEKTDEKKKKPSKERGENGQPKKSSSKVSFSEPGRGAGVAATSFVGAQAGSSSFHKPSKGKGKGKPKVKGMGCFICGANHLARDCPNRPAEGERFRRDAERANAAFKDFESKLRVDEGDQESSLLASSPWSNDVEGRSVEWGPSRGDTNGDGDDAMTMFITLDASRAAQALLASSPMASRYSQARCDRYINEAVTAALAQYAATQQENPGDVAGGGAAARDQSGWD